MLAARIISRLAAAPSTHAMRVQEVLGLRDADRTAVANAARELGIETDGHVAVVGFDGADASVRLAEVLALSASAFRSDAQVAANASRVYVLLPDTGRPAAVTSWIRGTIAALRSELGLTLRAVIATPQRVSRAWRPRGQRSTGCSTAPSAAPAPSVR